MAFGARVVDVGGGIVFAGGFFIEHGVVGLRGKLALARKVLDEGSEVVAEVRGKGKGRGFCAGLEEGLDDGGVVAGLAVPTVL